MAATLKKVLPLLGPFVMGCGIGWLIVIILDVIREVSR